MAFVANKQPGQGVDAFGSLRCASPPKSRRPRPTEPIAGSIGRRFDRRRDGNGRGKDGGSISGLGAADGKQAIQPSFASKLRNEVRHDLLEFSLRIDRGTDEPSRAPPETKGIASGTNPTPPIRLISETLDEWLNLA
jgi:hypothetical protein